MLATIIISAIAILISIATYARIRLARLHWKRFESLLDELHGDVPNVPSECRCHGRAK